LREKREKGEKSGTLELFSLSPCATKKKEKGKKKKCLSRKKRKEKSSGATGLPCIFVEKKERERDP